MAAGITLLFGAHASFALDFQSSRTLSLAQGGRGGALLNDTITLNPSLLGFQPVSAFSGTFNWVDGSRVGTSDDQQRLYNVSVIDGKNEYVNAGLSFTRRHDLDFIHVALAKRVTPAFSLGASAKRFSTRSNTKGAFSFGGTAQGFDTGLSASFVTPKDMSATPIQIGLTGDNLLHREQDEKYTGPRNIGLGAKVTLESMLMLYGDLVENLSYTHGSYLQWSGSAEVAVGNGFFGRGGLFGGKREKGWSVGGGWTGPKIAIGYGYQKTKVDAARGFDHAVTMDIFM